MGLFTILVVGIVVALIVGVAISLPFMPAVFRQWLPVVALVLWIAWIWFSVGGGHIPDPTVHVH